MRQTILGLNERSENDNYLPNLRAHDAPSVVSREEFEWRAEEGDSFAIREQRKWLEALAIGGGQYQPRQSDKSAAALDGFWRDLDYYMLALLVPLLMMVSRPP